MGNQNMFMLDYDKTTNLVHRVPLICGYAYQSSDLCIAVLFLLFFRFFLKIFFFFFIAIFQNQMKNYNISGKL